MRLEHDDGEAGMNGNRISDAIATLLLAASGAAAAADGDARLRRRGGSARSAPNEAPTSTAALGTLARCVRAALAATGLVSVGVGYAATDAERPAYLVDPPASGAIYTPDHVPPCDTWYPIEALKANAQGATTLQVLIDPGGSVREARVEKSAGHADLDEQAAACALRKGRSQPPIVDGKPGWKWQAMKVVWRIPADVPAPPQDAVAADAVPAPPVSASLPDLERAANSGSVTFQRLLGELYREGRGHPSIPHDRCSGSRRRRNRGRKTPSTTLASPSCKTSRNPMTTRAPQRGSARRRTNVIRTQPTTLRCCMSPDPESCAIRRWPSTGSTRPSSTRAPIRMRVTKPCRAGFR